MRTDVVLTPDVVRRARSTCLLWTMSGSVCGAVTMSAEGWGAMAFTFAFTLMFSYPVVYLVHRRELQKRQRRG